MKNERTGTLERRITGGGTVSERHLWPDGMPAEVRTRLHARRNATRNAQCNCDCLACRDNECDSCSVSNCEDPNCEHDRSLTPGASHRTIDSRTADQIIAEAKRRVTEARNQHREDRILDIRLDALRHQVHAGRWAAGRQARAIHAQINQFGA
jgi:hypothetical protein